MISLINLMEKKMAAKESKKPSIDKINLENRILAAFSLMEMCKTDAENISAGDLTELYQKVADLNKRAFEDETVFNIVAEHELDQVSNIEQLKEKIRRNRVVSTYKQLGFFALCSGSTKERIPEAPEILATIMHNMGIKNADALSEAIVNRQLDDESADKLFKELNGRQNILKKMLISDFKTYQDQKTRNETIEQIRPDLEEYTFQKNPSVEYSFEIRKQQKEFRKAVRQNFNEETKPEFLKFYGAMMTEGKNAAQGSSIGSTYSAFCQMIQADVGKEAAGAEIDRALGLSAEDAAQPDIEAKRKAAYKEKCLELYFKTVAGILSQKYEYNRKHNIGGSWDMYLRNINDNYIRSLNNGVNDIGSLAFQDADYSKQFISKAEEYKMNRDMRDETAEQQIISVHHKFPIGAAYDVYDQLCPPVSEKEKIENCQRLVNVRSNNVFVIGQEKHQSMEPRGTMKFGVNPDAGIFAARINCPGLRIVMRSLPPYMQEGIAKYVKMGESEKTKDIAVTMRFSEPKEITALRESLRNEDTHVSAIQKFTRYYNDGK